MKTITEAIVTEDLVSAKKIFESSMAEKSLMEMEDLKNAQSPVQKTLQNAAATDQEEQEFVDSGVTSGPAD